MKVVIERKIDEMKIIESKTIFGNNAISLVP